MKPRGLKEAAPTAARGSHRDQEWYDAEIARKLQEEELLVSTFKAKVQAKEKGCVSERNHHSASYET